MPSMDIDEPLVSVIMGAFNEETHISSAIDCILNQEFTNFEFIIVNDGSTDNTGKIIKSYTDKRIILIEQENRGLTASLNEGLKIARGKYIARQDADDISYSQRFSQQVNFLEKFKAVVLLGTRAKINSHSWTSLTPVIQERDVKKLLKTHNIFVHASVMIRASAFRGIGFYDEKYKTSQDYDAWLKLSRVGEIAILGNVLVERNILPNSITGANHYLQCLNGYRIRKGHVSTINNIRNTSYHYLAGIVPDWIVVLLRKLKFIGWKI